MSQNERDKLARLSDMLCCHIIGNRDKKALLIAQHLRTMAGFRLVNNLNHTTGHRELGYDESIRRRMADVSE